MARAALLVITLPVLLAGVTAWLVWQEMRAALDGERRALDLLRRQGLL